MQSRLTACLLALFVLTTDAAAAEPFAVGLSELRIDEDGSRSLDAHVWYPAEAEGSPTLTADNPVWQGFEAYPDAPLAAGRFPLVVLSHGLYGNSFNQAWLAVELARAGVIVAAPNHPGTTTFDHDPEERAKLWLRPNDLSRTISAVLDHERFTSAVAPGRIAAIGHSLGGYTVMALAGARFDTKRYAVYCDAHPDRADCKFYRSSGISSDAESVRALEASSLDLRVGAVVTLDLGLTQGFDPASLTAVAVPVLVIGAGSENSLLPLDAESRALAAALPAGRVRYLEPADARHFTFLGVCKPGAEAILKAESPGDEIVCRDGGGRDRPTLHAMLVGRVKAFLREAGFAVEGLSAL